MYQERGRAVLGTWDIAKIVAIIMIIVGLWLLPSFVHLRQEFEIYNETIVNIRPTGKNYVERGFIIYGPMESDVKIFVNSIVPNALRVRIYVLDSLNYNYYQNGLWYHALYVSENASTHHFIITIPPGNGQETTWYLVFQNTNSFGIDVVYFAGINYERTFLYYPYIVWVSRIGIVIVLLFVAWVIVSKRYEIRIVH